MTENGSEKGVDVVVGVITRCRPKMLAECLESLACQDILGGEVRVAVIIVDNDTEQSALPVYQDVENIFPCDIRYIVEKKKGIPFARNRVLEFASSQEANFVAFIDDDEVAAKDWLTSLYSIIAKNKVEAVQGRVLSLLPDCSESLPSWAAKAKRSEKLKKEGAPLRALRTNNVIFSSKLFDEDFLRFDEKFALSGGSDIDFFEKSSLLNNRHIWTNLAVVYEKIPASRLTLKWNFFRSYRVGAANTLICMQRKGILYALRRYLLKILARLLCGFFLFFTLGLFSGNIRFLSVQWLGSGLGHLLGFWGLIGSEYKKIHGH